MLEKGLLHELIASGFHITPKYILKYNCILNVSLKMGPRELYYPNPLAHRCCIALRKISKVK